MKKLIVISFLLIIAFTLYSLKTIEIYPQDKKQSTEIYIKKGDTIKIEATGKWTLWDKYEAVDGQGHQFVANEYGNWGALLGKIGNNKPFHVGNGLEFTSKNEGILYLFPNKDRYKMENQSGSLEVTVYGGESLDSFINSFLNNATHITLNSKDGFKTTGIFVEKGESLEIYSFGSWTMWNGVYSEVSGEGHDFNADGVPWGKLYGGIGSSDGQYQEIFPIGERASYTSTEAGILSLFPYTGNYISDENGNLDIYITGGRKASAEDEQKTDEIIRKKTEDVAISTINEIRIMAMLPKIESFPNLSQSASSHAKYMIINDVFSRDEQQGKSYFTGETLTDRLNVLGYNGKSHEMFCLSASAKEAISLFANTVYHRIRLLDPNLKYVGYGSYSSKDKIIHVFDLGYRNENDKKQQWDVILYPSNNITDVNISWNGIENPDPFPTGTNKPLGYPITIIFNEKINQVINAELTDENGKTVNTFIITPQTDLNNKKINAIIFVPKKPLEKNTKYVVSATVNVGEDKKEKAYTWAFNTIK